MGESQFDINQSNLVCLHHKLNAFNDILMYLFGTDVHVKLKKVWKKISHILNQMSL